MSTLNQFFSRNSSIPVGSVRIITANASTLAPAPDQPNPLVDASGTWVKTGLVYSQTDYPELFAQLGKIDASDYMGVVTPTTAQGPTLQKVSYVNGTYVQYGGPGSANVHAYNSSTDGITWTQAGTFTATTTDITDMTYGNGLYVVTGAAGNILTNTAITGTWTTRTNFSSFSISNLRYLNNKFFYLNISGTTSTVPGSVGYSTDGVTWSANTANTVSEILKVIFGNSNYVMSSGAGLLRTSTDMKNWSIATSGTTSTIRGMVYANAQYVVVGDGGMIRTSPDLVTWTARTSGTTSVLYTAEYGTLLGVGQYIATGAGGVIRTSTDGITWTTRTSNTTAILGAAAYINNNVIAVGADTIDTSTDGVTWTVKSFASPTTSVLNGITYGNGVYVAVGAGGVIRRSTNALEWTAPTSGTTSVLNGAAYGNGIYLAVGAGGAAVKSTDGTTWTAATSGTTSAINTVIFDGTKFVASGAGGMIRTTTDGVTWTAATSGTTSIINGSTYANGNYYVVGNGGMIRSSTDLVTWNLRTSGTVSVLYGISYVNNRYVAVGQSVITSSTDGVTWAAVAVPTAPTNGALSVLRTVAYDGGQYIALGYGTSVAGYALKAVSQNGTTWSLYDDTTNSGVRPGCMASIIVNGGSSGRIIGVGGSGSVQHIFPDTPNAMLSAWRSGVGGLLPKPFVTNSGIYYINTKQSSLFTSTNLSNWDLVSFPQNNTIGSAYIVYDSINNLFIRQQANTISYSSDLATWTDVHTNPLISANTTSATYFTFAGGVGGYSVFMGTNGLLVSSQNPYASFTTVPNIGINPLDIAYNGSNTYVAVGYGGLVSTSTDGLTWNAPVSISSGNLYSIVYANSKFVTATYTSTASIKTSTDGVTWTNINVSPTTMPIRNVAHDGTKFKAIGTDGSITTSTDGSTWTYQSKVLPLSVTGTSLNIDGPLYILSNSTTTLYTTKNIGVKEYSPSYNVNTSFLVPTITTSNSYATSANSYDTEAVDVIYIKAKL